MQRPSFQVDRTVVLRRVAKVHTVHHAGPLRALNVHLADVVARFGFGLAQNLARAGNSHFHGSDQPDPHEVGDPRKQQVAGVSEIGQAAAARVLEQSPPHENLVRAAQIAELLVLPVRPDDLSGDAGGHAAVSIHGGEQILACDDNGRPANCARQLAIFAAP